MSSNKDDLVLALQRIDPLLQFLTKATGQTAVPLPTLRRILPTGYVADEILENVQALAQRGVLQLQSSSTVSWECSDCLIGFPDPTDDKLDKTIRQGLGNLHGSTKTAAKRRLTALKRILKAESKGQDTTSLSEPIVDSTFDEEQKPPAKEWGSFQQEEPDNGGEEPILEQEKDARDALWKILGFQDRNAVPSVDKDALPTVILSKQVSYAGSNPAQSSAYAELSKETSQQIPPSLKEAFGLQRGSVKHRQLYKHQVAAIESALAGTHTSVCTGTGSGKSMGFLIPILTCAYNTDAASLVLFPTKALAQDQLSKLQSLLSRHPDLSERIRPSTLDGDTPHAGRADIAKHCNIILTNPDTLHAAVLPAWKTLYKTMLARLSFVVIDEAHMYEGVFGAHMAMILSRLLRVSLAASNAEGRPLQLPTFLSASATLPWPEQHFRLLCPIAADAPVNILTSQDDGSPRSDKHFFVWNPPILKSDGTSTGKVSFPRPARPKDSKAKASGRKRPRKEEDSHSGSLGVTTAEISAVDGSRDEQYVAQLPGQVKLHRRHAADETALLLAKAMSNGVRCIAFCKTRNLVEWVYERVLAAIKSDPATAVLASRLESYRGGYSMVERRQIEQRLFKNELLGVVGTNALELGVDIGGIDLTLHCGYPSSYASLLQQAGRAGRGGARLDVPSCAVVICFNSPSEQHLWRHPKSLLGKGVSAPNSIPINGGLVQGHLLCASEEFPLTGSRPVSAVQSIHQDEDSQQQVLNDFDLFGGQATYEEALEVLLTSGSVVKESVAIASPRSENNVSVMKAHPSMSKAWSRVSIRSIEPVNYVVVDVSHPGQAGRTNGIHDESAIMDSLPYSRVFYHAHPGAVITHRGKRYKVLSMTRPPAFFPDNFGYRRSLNLAAFAKPTNAKYATRPLSNLHITVVKQMERVELQKEIQTESPSDVKEPFSPAESGAKAVSTLAGCGAVNVRRSVHGYKKLSLITRAELSRSELSLPEMEYDTFGIWIDTEAHEFSAVLGDRYGPGVHALSHALLAVAPLFVSGLARSDLECDHSFVAPTRIMLFDERAGGSGASERIWEQLFQPNGVVEAAVDLLEDCSSCRWDSGYDGGCPACIHASQCLKFNMHLSRSAAIVIGKRILENLRETHMFKANAEKAKRSSETTAAADGPKNSTPRRKARIKALRNAKEMRTARDRKFVVGRPSWPLDGDERQGRQVDGDCI